MARLAKSLVTLRNEINALAPNRSKVSDGWIGDAAHRSRASRHNPNRYGVVTALDITNDPANGCPIHEIADRVRRNPHPQLRYLISNGRIASRPSWTWRTYRGSNRHDRHVHFAVGVGPDSNPQPPYDSTRPWGVAATPGGGKIVTVKVQQVERDDSGGAVKSLQALLVAKAGQRLALDGVFGSETEAAVKRVQRFFELAQDGVVGPKTWGVMFL